MSAVEVTAVVLPKECVYYARSPGFTWVQVSRQRYEAMMNHGAKHIQNPS